MANEELLKKAVEAFDALSPEQKATMLEEQRQSWVRGNVGLSRDERGITTPVMPRPAAPVEGLGGVKEILTTENIPTAERDRAMAACQEIGGRLTKAEADNAALTERVRELTSPEYLTEKLEQVGVVDKEWQERAQALETQLAAAKKALTDIQCIDWDGLSVSDVFDEINEIVERAALEDRP